MNISKQTMKEMGDLFSGLSRYLDKDDELWNRVHYSIIKDTIICEISRVLKVIVIDHEKENSSNV